MRRKKKVVHGTFLDFFNKSITDGGLYTSVKLNTVLVDFGIPASNGSSGGGGTSDINDQFFRTTGGQAEHKVTGVIESVRTTAYIKDDYRIIPKKPMVSSSCLSIADSSGCHYPEYTVNVVIPAFKTNGEPDIILTDIQFPPDGQTKNCTSYKSILSDGNVQLYQAANANYRDFNYCTCNEQYTKCKEGATDCSCQLCHDVPDQVKYAACHGEYGVEANAPNVNPDEEEIRRDKICFYIKDDWDFLTGMSSSSTGYWDINGQAKTKRLFCANLPTMCYALKSPADWNGNGVWANESVLSGKIDVVGECASGYEPQGREIKLKEPSNCDQRSTCIVDKQRIKALPAIYDRNNHSFCQYGGCENVLEAEWIENYSGEGSGECKQYFQDGGCFVTPCANKSSNIDGECYKSLFSLYPTATIAFEKLKIDKTSKDDIVREKDLLNDKGAIKAYIDKYASCCNDKPSGYTNKAPSDSNKPKADCVAGIYENFRDHCVKK